MSPVGSLWFVSALLELGRWRANVSKAEAGPVSCRQRQKYPAEQVAAGLCHPKHNQISPR